jgi:hypothetical protein
MGVSVTGEDVAELRLSFGIGEDARVEFETELFARGSCSARRR